jgi:aspartate dehydrogenase
VREGQVSSATRLSPLAQVFTDIDSFLAAKLDVVVECASPKTLALYGADILAAGPDLIPLSLGALADEETEQRIANAAKFGQGRLEIPAGALGSIGFLTAGRENNLSKVRVTVAYPIERWKLMGGGRS